MKKTGKWIISVFTRVFVIILVVLLLPYAKYLFQLIVPGITGEIMTHSMIIEQKLESSQRLEVTSINEEGTLIAKTSVIIFGEVGSTEIRYRYTASAGIDLKKVILTAETDRIIFTLPDPEILNDGIEALEIKKNDFFSHAIDSPPAVLLAEQREKCRNQYLNETLHIQKIRDDAEKAFTETVCQWLDHIGDHHYEFEIRFTDHTAAE